MSQADPDKACVTADYQLIDETTISVNNSNIFPANDGSGQKQLQFILGQGIQTEPETFPNKLYVSFNFGGQPSITVGESNYFVMDTDYENYSIVMPCTNNGVYTVEYGYILGRNQAFFNTDLFKEVLAKAETEFDFKTNRAEKVPQSPEDCKFDFVAANRAPDRANIYIYKSISNIFKSAGQILFITYKLSNTVLQFITAA